MRPRVSAAASPASGARAGVQDRAARGLLLPHMGAHATPPPTDTPTHTCTPTPPDTKTHTRTHADLILGFKKQAQMCHYRWSETVRGNNGPHLSFGNKAFFSGAPGTPGLALAPDWLDFGDSFRGRSLSVPKAVSCCGLCKGEPRHRSALEFAGGTGLNTVPQFVFTWNLRTSEGDRIWKYGFADTIC